jgi:hypothetical protein
MQSDNLLRPARRRFLPSAADLATAAGAIPFIITSHKALGAGKMLLVIWGGSDRAAVENALVKPFSQEFSVELTLLDTPHLAKVSRRAR